MNPLLTSTLLMFLAGLAASVPLPQLTLSEFQSRGRSLEDPSPLVSESYATVRRQGRKGSSEIIKFPTLEVRNPNELTFASPVQNTAFAAGPVYKSNNELSTQDIEAKIKLINAEEVIVKEEQLLESIVTSEVEEEIEELTDVLAAEIVAEELAEEIEELTDVLAAEIVAEELAEEMAEELVELELAEDIAENIAEDIDELTDIEAAEIVIEELEEGSGIVPTVDFGDITEVLFGI